MTHLQKLSFQLTFHQNLTVFISKYISPVSNVLIIVISKPSPTSEIAPTDRVNRRCCYESYYSLTSQKCLIKRKCFKKTNLACIIQPCFHHDTCKNWLHGVCMDEHIKERPPLSSFQDSLKHRYLCAQCLKDSHSLISEHFKDRNRRKKVTEFTKITKAVNRAVRTTQSKNLCCYDTDSCFKCERSGPITVCASNHCMRLIHI